MPNVIARVFALLAGVLLAGSAHAILFQGTFDPPYYRGTATFDVPSDCINNNPGENFVTPDVDCSSVNFVSATVIHDGDPANAIHFDTAQSDVVRLLRWVNGVLFGVDTDPVASGFDPIGANSSIDGTFWNTSPNFPPYYLQFSAGSFDETELSALAVDPPATVTLFTCPDGFSTCGQVDPNGGPALQDPFVPVPVPEPGSLALIAGGLVAGWAARRRRAG